MNYYNYFSEIEETFIRRRGRNLLLSPLDWALIESWQERGVPLHVVLRGIEKVFDTLDRQPPGRRRTVNSLLYCKEEIEAQYAEWLERQVGKPLEENPDTEAPIESKQTPAAEPDAGGDGAAASKNELFPPEAIAAHLEKTVLELAAAQRHVDGPLRETLELAALRLAEAGKDYQSTEALEETLEKLDTLIDETLLRTFEIKNLKAEVEKELAAYRSKMEADVFRRTQELMLLKRIRDEQGIPRLSLFSL